jgi:Ca2+-transporting ATPase
MITGDHALTARAIARDVGLLGEAVHDGETGGGDVASRAKTAGVIDGPQLEAMTDEQLRAVVCETRVYARVDPEHKLRIVDALKRNGEIVAMTGDGVNDAPALKRADIGVAMGRVGTDVARDASDLVLADDDFATIVHAVELGRVVYDNLRKVILFLLSCNMSEVLVVFLTALLSPATALLPLQLLWINLVTDGLPALALGVDPSEAGVMDRPPRDARESILSAGAQLQIVWQGAVMTATALALYYAVAPAIPGTTPAAARTMLFTALVLTQLLHAFDFRSTGGTVWHARSLSNRWLVLSLCGSMVLQAAIIYIPALSGIFKTAPLSALQWVAVLGTGLLSVAVMDASKLLAAHRTPAREGVHR